MPKICSVLEVFLPPQLSLAEAVEMLRLKIPFQVALPCGPYVSWKKLVIKNSCKFPFGYNQVHLILFHRWPWKLLQRQMDFILKSWSHLVNYQLLLKRGFIFVDHLYVWFCLSSILSLFLHCTKILTSGGKRKRGELKCNPFNMFKEVMKSWDEYRWVDKFLLFCVVFW